MNSLGDLRTTAEEAPMCSVQKKKTLMAMNVNLSDPREVFLRLSGSCFGRVARLFRDLSEASLQCDQYCDVRLTVNVDSTWSLPPNPTNNIRYWLNNGCYSIFIFIFLY